MNRIDLLERLAEELQPLLDACPTCQDDVRGDGLVYRPGAENKSPLDMTTADIIPCPLCSRVREILRDLEVTR